MDCLEVNVQATIVFTIEFWSLHEFTVNFPLTIFDLIPRFPLLLLRYSEVSGVPNLIEDLPAEQNRFMPGHIEGPLLQLFVVRQCKMARISAQWRKPTFN